jgi:hypothetical protein
MHEQEYQDLELLSLRRTIIRASDCIQSTYSTFHKNDSDFSTKKAEKSISSVRCLNLKNKKSEVNRFPAFYFVFLRDWVKVL